MRGIEHLHPELKVIAADFSEKCLVQGLNVLITETFRTEAEQNGLYAKGRTLPGNIVTNCKYPQSPHCWGVAFDFCRNERGCEYDDKDGFFKKCGEVGKKLGLFWGGDFKSFVDKPHLELEKYLPSNSVKTLQNKYGTPDAFVASWGNPAKPAVELSAPQKLPTLKLGQKGESVKILQQALCSAGYTIGIDGSWGKQTNDAVTDFQIKHFGKADGIVGSNTWKALKQTAPDIII